jgi:hypothetical protein
MLDLDPGKPGEFVLSSRDFARVYLRSGPVANYVYDLVRRYTVLLVGYAADDPTMRYLMDAIGEDAGLFEDMKRPYAIAGRSTDSQDPNGEVVAHTWRAKNIEPILYVYRPGDARHDPLWESLREWAEWARTDIEWVKDRLAIATAAPRSSTSEFHRAFVQDLLRLLDENEQIEVIKHLRHHSVSFDWITAIMAASEYDISPDAKKGSP